MGRLTFCPHYLLEYSLDNPNDIEREIILPLHTNIKHALNNGVEIFLSKEIVTIFQHTYPWNLMSNPDWKGYIRIWHDLITQNIVNKCTLVSVPRSTKSNQIVCNHLSATINDIFVDFLNVFLTRDMPSSHSEEGIFANLSCGNALSTLGAYILLNHNNDNINYIKYPWLRIYSKPLPPTGEYPFIPPFDWKNYPSPRKGKKYGFLDDHGNEWVWDRKHHNHWDVQDGTPRTNVSPDGKILWD